MSIFETLIKLHIIADIFCIKYINLKARKITSEIISSIAGIEDLKKLSEEAFKADAHKIGSAKYSLIIAKKGLRKAEDYADTFRVMNEQGAFDQEFTDSLIQMAGFRNRLVHIYWDIDDSELFRIIQDRLAV